MTVKGSPDDALGVLYRGGNVVTMDPENPGAEAVATRQGRIIAVGAEVDCRSAIGIGTNRDGGIPGARVVDLGGATLLPAFHDVHLHPMPMAFFEYHLDLTPCESVAEVLDAVGDRAKSIEASEWVLGLQIDEARLTDKRLPTRAELDSVAPGVPIVLLRRDGHTALGNSAALQGAGIREGEPDPEGGRFVRDSSGDLTGLCNESAAQLLMGAVPMPGMDQLRAGLGRAFERLAAEGIATAGIVIQSDAEGPAGTAGELECLAIEMFRDEIPMATNAIVSGADVAKIGALRESGLHDPAAARRVTSLKIYLDGTFGARTARMRDPYTDDGSTRGMLTLDEAICAERAEVAHVAGLQVCIHAIGDEANEVALSMLAGVIERNPGHAVAHRIEHASALASDLVERFAESRVIAAVQPLFVRSERDWLGQRLGSERLAWVYPFRSLLDAGVTVAGASDAPIEEPSVLAAIHTAVTRHGFEEQQCVSVAEALAMFTRDAAVAGLCDDETGSITEGKRADLVMLSDDPLSVPADAIPSIEVLLTVSQGGEIFRDARGLP